MGFGLETYYTSVICKQNSQGFIIYNFRQTITTKNEQ